MQPLTSTTQDLVSALERERTLTDRVLGRTGDDLRILAELRARPEAGAVPYLLPLVYGARSAIARVAARALTACIDTATPSELVELDDECRRSWTTYTNRTENGWPMLRSADVARLGAFGEDEVTVVGVASFHSNGWVREQAVVRLGAFTGGSELPFLLVRLNDWVDVIAERAEQAVRQRLVPDYADAFASSLATLLRPAQRRRRVREALLAAVEELLRDPESRPALERGLSAASVTVRRFMYRVAREAPSFQRDEVLRAAAADPDTVIRLEAVRAARDGSSLALLTSLLPRIIADSYPRIRREGVAAAAELLGDDANATLVGALLDRNQVVRETARFLLLRRGLMRDAAQFYRDRLDTRSVVGPDARRLVAAIDGLGETGVAGDAELLTPFLVHERPALRRAAARAVAALGIEPYLDRITAMLGDPSPIVSATARKILRPRAAIVGLAAVRAAFRQAREAHNRFDAASVGSALDKWDSAPMLLEAAASDDPRVVRSAGAWLRRWVANQNRSSIQPTRAQLIELRDALTTYASAADRSVVAELRANLKYWDTHVVSRNR
jgi:hypothetical protein